MGAAPRTVDYLIIGAGMAGTTLARFLRRDRRVVVLDPRPGGYKVGESIIPEHYHHPELRALVEAARKLPSYSPKAGITFMAGRDIASFPLPPHGAEVAMHVARHELEPLMHQAWNTPIHTERVRQVDPTRRLVTTDKGQWRVRELILDCSGPAMVVARRCGQLEELYPTFARWAYFDIREIDEARFWGHLRRHGYAYRRFDVPNGRFMSQTEDPHWRPARQTLLTRIARTVWTWQIPLYNETVLSFGVVSRSDRIDTRAFHQIVERYHAPHYTLQRRPSGGHSPRDRVHTRSRFAQRARPVATLDYVLCGDAAAFGDPVYSVGTGMAVNKAIELAAILNEGPWDEARCRRWCADHDALVDRAMAAFEIWYKGDLLTSDAAAAEVQQGFLQGSAFQVGVATHYSRVLNDAGAPADVPGPDGRGRHQIDPAQPPLTEALIEILGLETDHLLAGWSLVAAYRTPSEVQQRWAISGKPELQINTTFCPEVTRYLKRVGPISLSFMNLWDRPYPVCDRTRALFDALEARIREREADWIAWGRALFGA